MTLRAYANGGGGGAVSNGAVDYEGYLHSHRVVVWPEGAIAVADDDLVVVGRLHVDIEGVVGGHVGEVWASVRIYRQPFGKHDDLGQLPSRQVGVWVERANRLWPS